MSNTVDMYVFWIPWTAVGLPFPIMSRLALVRYITLIARSCSNLQIIVILVRSLLKALLRRVFPEPSAAVIVCRCILMPDTVTFTPAFVSSYPRLPELVHEYIR